MADATTFTCRLFSAAALTITYYCRKLAAGAVWCLGKRKHATAWPRLSNRNRVMTTVHGLMMDELEVRATPICTRLYSQSLSQHMIADVNT